MCCKLNRKFGVEGELEVVGSRAYGGIVCGMFIRKDERKKWDRNRASSGIG